MTSTENNDGSVTVTSRFSICEGWRRWLTCLTIIVVVRHVGQLMRQDRSELPVTTASFVVDLNTAKPHELKALPEVGNALAARIVAHRQTHGPFTAVDSLLNVPGVGPRTLEQLRPMLTIGSGTETVPTLLSRRSPSPAVPP